MPPPILFAPGALKINPTPPASVEQPRAPPMLFAPGALKINPTPPAPVEPPRAHPMLFAPGALMINPAPPASVEQPRASPIPFAPSALRNSYTPPFSVETPCALVSVATPNPTQIQAEHRSQPYARAYLPWSDPQHSHPGVAGLGRATCHTLGDYAEVAAGNNIHMDTDGYFDDEDSGSYFDDEGDAASYFDVEGDDRFYESMSDLTSDLSKLTLETADTEMTGPPSPHPTTTPTPAFRSLGQPPQNDSPITESSSAHAMSTSSPLARPITAMPQFPWGETQKTTPAVAQPSVLSGAQAPNLSGFSTSQTSVLNGAQTATFAGFGSSSTKQSTPGQATSALYPTAQVPTGFGQMAGQSPLSAGPSSQRPSSFGQPSVQTAASTSNPFAQMATPTSTSVSMGAGIAGAFSPPTTSAFGTLAPKTNGGTAADTLNNPFSKIASQSSSPFATAIAPTVSTNGGLATKETSAGAVEMGTGTENPFSQPLNKPTAANPDNPFAALAPLTKETLPPLDNPFSAIQKKDAPTAAETGPQKPSTSSNGGGVEPGSVSGSNRKRKNGFPERNESENKKPAQGSSRPQPPLVPLGPQSEYAEKIQTQLRKDGLTEPKWPNEPGNPGVRSNLENLREATKKYRERVRLSLQKAELIDDPNVRRRLEDAIDFKGICEDMCPEFEKLTRIVQFDVKSEEKAEAPDGTMWPSTQHMVKALARSAAGQELPLPMDVRSIPALKRTLDYLVDEVLVEDKNLPSRHNFLWDRTRAIRRDFVFHTTKEVEELERQIYCLENIARFHVTALHLLSQKGFAAPDFSEQQEREQLSKSLISLIEIYDDCAVRNIECQNEAEFRAYSILLNQKLELSKGFWNKSDEVQTAVSLVQAMQSIWDWQGPLKPATPTAAASAFATFFRIVEDPKVSYTMACFAEVHFAPIRRSILQTLAAAYSRTRDAPKDITLSVVNAMLRFDSDEEAVDFVNQHDLEFSDGADTEPYLVLSKQGSVSRPTPKQVFSQQLVERKRSHHSLPELIHTTVFEEATSKSVPNAESRDGLFVNNTPFLSEEHKELPTKQSAASFISGGPSAFAPSTSSPAPNIVQPSAPASKPQASLPSFPAPSLAQEAPKLPKPPVSLPAVSPANAVRNKQDQGSQEQAETAKSSTILAKPMNGSSHGNATPVQFSNSPAAPPISPAPNITVTPPTPGRVPLTSSDARIGPSVPADSVAQAQAPTVTAAPQAGSTSLDSPKTLDTPTPPTAAPQPASTATKPLETGNPTTSLSAPLQDPAKGTQMPSSGAFTLEKQQDPMGSFTKWVAFGDMGLWAEFHNAYLQHLLMQTFEQHQHEEAERKRIQEDQESWAQALQFRRTSLSVTYFYRWRRNAHELSLNRRIQLGKEQRNAWRAEKAAEQRAAHKRAEAEAKTIRQAEEQTDAIQELLASTRRRKEMQAKQALLATGIFNGVHDDREVASRVVRGAHQPADIPSASSTPSKSRRPPMKVLREGLSHSVSKVKDLFAKPTTTRAGIATTRNNHSPTNSIVTGISKGSSGNSYGSSTISRIGRQSLTSKLRANFLKKSNSRPASSHAVGLAQDGRRSQTREASQDFRRSLPLNRSRVPSFSQSLSSAADKRGRVTNFSQHSRSAVEPPAEEKSAVHSAHWKLRSMGMIRMPNREYLHESLAIPLMEGKRFPGIGTYGLPPAANDKAAEEETDEQTYTPTNSPPGKRKRATGVDECAVADLKGKRKAVDDSPPDPKKQRAAYDPEETTRIIREAREAAAAMEEGKEWFKEQRELMETGASPWDR